MAKYVKTEQGYQEIETTVAPMINQEIETTVVPMVGEKIDKNNPVGTGSFSMGRKPNTVIGSRSHAEGYITTASSNCSHAEGYVTTASNYYSHAEGVSTIASGESSHAEGGSTTASGYCSHAEGSHTTASGFNSHAEGDGATASGDRSHAEGLSTTASSQDQHVQGKFNVEDSQGKYAHIVGNGTSSARSNAHTLDWNGNVWFAGNVYTGSTSGINKDEGSKKLATEEYVDSKQGTAEEYELIFTDTVTEDTAAYFRDTDANGNTFALKKVILIVFTPPYEESDTSYGRGVGFLPTVRWGHDCISTLGNPIKSSAGGTGQYDVFFVEIIMGYQVCTAKFESQNTTNVFSVMQPVTKGGVAGLQFVRDATKLMQISNPTGNMTCVKIVGYASPIIAKNTQIALYGVRA